MKWFPILLDWSEVWALLIPLLVAIISRPAGENIRLLVWYVVLGFLLNVTAMLMQYNYLSPRWMYIDGMTNNNIIYNIHSIIRVLLFSWYIITIRKYNYSVILKTILLGYIVFLFINFIFFESIFYISSLLFAAESIVLLIMCMFYFFHSIQDESQLNWLKHPSFLVCAGLSFYEAITFFIFLFLYPLSQKDETLKFFVLTMRIYNITYVIFCILLALAFYRSRKNKQKQGGSVIMGSRDH
jgi:hypothetical protein